MPASAAAANTVTLDCDSRLIHTNAATTSSHYRVAGSSLPQSLGRAKTNFNNDFGNHFNLCFNYIYDAMGSYRHRCHALTQADAATSTATAAAEGDWRSLGI